MQAAAAAAAEARAAAVAAAAKEGEKAKVAQGMIDFSRIERVILREASAAEAVVGVAVNVNSPREPDEPSGTARTRPLRRHATPRSAPHDNDDAYAPLASSSSVARRRVASHSGPSHSGPQEPMSVPAHRGYRPQRAADGAARTHLTKRHSHSSPSRGSNGSPSRHGGQRFSGRRSPEMEDLRWLAKLEKRETQQASAGANGTSVTASQLAAQTTAALRAIQQQVDALGLVAVFDSIAGARADQLSAAQLAKALRHLGVFVEGDVGARLLSRLIIRSINQRQSINERQRTLSFDVFCALFDKQGALRDPVAPHQEATPAALLAVGGCRSTPPSSVSFSPSKHDSPQLAAVNALLRAQRATTRPSEDFEAPEVVRQHQRYLKYLHRCQQQGVEPDPAVAAMALEMMANTKDTLTLAATGVRNVEHQLRIGEELLEAEVEV